MRTFFYSIKPSIKNGELYCDFKVITEVSDNLKSNLDFYMKHHLTSELRRNQRLYSLLDTLARDENSYPLVMKFEPIYYDTVDILVDQEMIGHLTFNLIAKDMNTIFKIKKEIDNFIKKINGILEEDKNESAMPSSENLCQITETNKLSLNS